MVDDREDASHARDANEEVLRIAAEAAQAATRAAAAEQRRAEAEQGRADAEKQRADAENRRAEAEHQRAEAEKQRAAVVKERADIERARNEAERRATAEASERILTEERLKTITERLAQAQQAARKAEDDRIEAEKQLGAARRAVADVANKFPVDGQSADSESPPRDPTEAERQKLLFDIWSKAVDTQMHFNEMSTRQRALGLTFVVAALSLAVFLMTRGDAWALKPSLDKDQITTTNGALLYAGIIFFTICIWGMFPLEVNSLVDWLVRSGSKEKQASASPRTQHRSRWLQFWLLKAVVSTGAIIIATHWISADWGGIGVCSVIISLTWSVLSALAEKLRKARDSERVKQLVEWTRRFWFLRLLATIPVVLIVSPWMYRNWKRFGLDTLHAVAICVVVSVAWWFLLGSISRAFARLLPEDRVQARGRRLTVTVQGCRC